MARNYLYNLILTLSNILFPLVSFPYASRILGPESIGRVQFTVSFAQYFALFAALGIPIYGIKEIARCREQKEELSAVYSELFVIFFSTTIIVSLVYCASIMMFPFFSGSTELYLYGGLIIFLGFSYSDWFYSGVEDFKSIAIRSVVIKLIALLSLFVFVHDRADYSNYLLITVFSISGHHLAGLVGVRNRLNFTLTNLNLRRHLKPLLYIFSTTIAASMYTVLDIVLLGFLSDDRAVGYYTAAVKLTKIAIPVVTSLGVVLIPRISKGLKDGNSAEVSDLLDQAFGFVMFIAVPAVVGLALLAPEFMVLFSGEEFRDAAVSMQVLSLLPFIIGLGHFLAFLILVPAGHNREMFLAVMGGMVIGLISNFLLIPLYADRGAAVANVITEIAVTVFYFYFVRRHFKFTFRWSLLGKAFLSSIIFIPVIVLFRSIELPLPVSLTCSVLLCAAGYIAIQLFVFKNRLIGGFLSTRFNLKLKEESQ
jgi:O-antigen/teichoic acid export membrane protein